MSERPRFTRSNQAGMELRQLEQPNFGAYIGVKNSVSVMKKKSETVRTSTYESLKGEIIDGSYSPGELVRISEFARDLGVSRTPVRDALYALERDFLVDMLDGHGAVIRPLNNDEIQNINQLREIIDGLAARLSAKLMPDETIANLRAKFEKMMEEEGGAESELHSVLSQELHRTITDHCGNWVVQAQWKHLNTAFMRLKQMGWKYWLGSDERRSLSLSRLHEHLEILDALQSRDAARAEEAARYHVSRATNDLMKLNLTLREAPR